MATASPGFFRSSIGKKVVMAASGAILFGFVIGHMLGNLQVYLGPEAFNGYAEKLRHLPALLWTARAALLVAVTAHIASAYSLTRTSQVARPVGYRQRESRESTYASRTMRWGGVIIALFIVYHILDLTFGVANPDGTDSTPYDRLVASFQNPIATIVYVVTLILLGMHLRHGVWSATQTLGQSNRRRERSVNIFATAFATLLIAGYLVVPAAVVFGLVD